MSTNLGSTDALVVSRKHSKYGLLCESILGSRQSTRHSSGAFLLAPVLAGLVGKPLHIVLCDTAVVAPARPERGADVAHVYE